MTVDHVSHAARSAFPGAEADRRLKTTIAKAFGTASNDTLTAVCEDIAGNALNATFPTGSKSKPTQFCAII